MLTEREEWLSNEFQQYFTTNKQPLGEALHYIRAPGRVDLMGSHTDYNHGFVLTMAIGYDTLIAARPRSDRKVHIASTNLKSSSEFDLDDLRYDTQEPWSNYVRGVAWALQEAGYKLSGFDGMLHSNIPMASGLSSSAALEVATARLFDHLNHLHLDPVELAVLCLKAENQFVGLNCGILDQYTSSVCPIGQALLLDCRGLTSEIIQIPTSLRVVICDTRARRELTGSEYPARRASCERVASRLASLYPVSTGQPPQAPQAPQAPITHLRDVTLEQLLATAPQLPPQDVMRARYIIEENQRVLDLASALTADHQAIDIQATIRQLFEGSYSGARDLYEIVSPPMQQMMAAMLAAPGVIGARQAGAGFGGCMVAVVKAGMEQDFGASVKEHYLRETGIEPGIYLA